MSNSISVEVKKKETAISIVDYTNGVGVFTQNGTQFLKGLKPGDEVAVFDTSGKLLSIQKASAEVLKLTQRGFGLIKIKSNVNYTFLKSVN
jgi:archaeosine-15-forming tRNA-guanine transglycosylase